jgi:hypothetical protein
MAATRERSIQRPPLARALRFTRDGIGRWLAAPTFVDVAIGTLAVLLIASPLLFTSNGFAPDLTDDMWLSAVQQHMIANHLHPTLFLQTQQRGVFEPMLAFYGGALFTITGGLAVVLGGATLLAFEVVTVAAIAAAYGGLFWLARQLGVRRILAHAPALVFVTSAYYITNPYGRGAWAEFMAVSALPLMLAAALRLARGHWRVGPVICLVAATVVFSGSHNITLLLGSTIIGLALACYWLLSGRTLRLPWRRVLAVAGLIALSAALNGWFMLPDVIYANHTLISEQEVAWSATGFFNSFGVIFDPLRTVPKASGTPALYVQAPVLALVWGLLALPLVWRVRRLRAAVATVLIMLAGLLVVIMSEAVYSALPHLYHEIQFAFRLQTYVTLACSALVLLGALALTRRAERGRATGVDRAMLYGLGSALAVGVALAAWQLWVPNTHINGGYFSSYSNRAGAVQVPTTQTPKSWDSLNEFGDRTLPIVRPAAAISFDPAAVKDDHMAGVARFPAGQFATNIDGGPYLVHVGGGVHVVGRTTAGYLVLERNAAGSQPVPFELGAQLSTPVLLGRIATALAAAMLLALAVVAAVRRWRRRKATAAGP